MTAKIRASTVDGIFYPDTKEELHRLVSELLEQSDIPAGKAGFIVSPHTCYKAGLPGDCWKNNTTEIEVFSALVFHE